MKNISTFTPDKSRRIQFLLLISALVAGVIVGSVRQAADGRVASPWLYQFFLPPSGSGELRRYFLSTLVSSAVFLCAAFLSGLFTFGQPLGVLLLVYRGAGIGAAAAFMYSLTGAGAAVPVLLIVLPKAIALGMIAVLAVRELMRTSVSMLRFWLTGDAPENTGRSFRLYCVKFAV
ncbi:MAG: stage II sporulation protein M, partial [Ruminococcus sp.]|nr:stage II sporulation protein M [Ruminococcus sp.]